jgi:hypothetical protein
VQDRPYEKLKGTLWAETNEEIRESLYLTRSMIFDKLKSSKFAVKVINKWGGEEKGWIT